jgi:hypothetical protein
VRETSDFQTTITCSPVNRTDQILSLELSLQMTLPMPHQDEHLPDQIEAFVHHAGLEVQRRLFRCLIEKADHELVLQQRHGKAGAGIQRKGTRPFTFKTTSARSPSGGRASSTRRMARSRCPRRSPGTRPTSS